MTRPKQETKTRRNIAIIAIPIVALIIFSIVTYQPTPTPTPTLTPTPTPTAWKEVKQFAHIWAGYNATFVVVIKIEKDNRSGVADRERLAWKECSKYNITVELQTNFSGSDRVLIRQVSAILVNSQEQIEETQTSQKRDVVLTPEFPFSPEFEFTFHPQRGIVKMEICAKFKLIIQMEIYEYYHGKSERGFITEPFEITICS